MAYFNYSQKMPQELDSLFSIQQQNRESLKDYVTRFKVAILKIYNLDESVVMLAMKRELHSSQFTYSLDKTYSKSYSKLLVRAQKYISTKEGATIQQEGNGKLKKKKAQEKPNDTQTEKPNFFH